MTSRDEWIFSKRDIVSSKEELINFNILNMLNKSTMMFKYTNLPEYMNQKDIEIILQVGGYAVFKKVDDKLYAFRAGLGGEPNPYYLPTIATIANPSLRYNASLKIDEECVVMLNDHFYQGLMPIHCKYATMLAESELTLKQMLINARVPAIVTADNESSKASAEKFFEKIVKGEDYGIVLGKGFFENIKTSEFTKHNYITEAIEAIQYIKGSWYNEVGLKAAFNMKREAINEAEADLNDDILYPSVDNMLRCRKDGLKKINKMFGENIGVELDSTWVNTRIIDKLTVEEKEAEIEAIGGNANAD